MNTSTLHSSVWGRIYLQTRQSIYDTLSTFLLFQLIMAIVFIAIPLLLTIATSDFDLVQAFQNFAISYADGRLLLFYTGGLSLFSRVWINRVVHQVRDLEQIIDSVLVLEQGQIICQATVSEIASRLRFAPVQPGEATQPLYTEQSPLGLLGVFARGEDEEAEDFSMELFFNALLAARPAVLSALGAHHSTK